jgi:penicillin amidase
MATLAIAAAAALATLAAGAAVGYWAIFRRPLPRTSGRLEVDGPLAPLTIVRDAGSVPHVEAQGERDTAFAVGFLHGQERLWQLELLRRIAAGRLSELIGPRGLPVDRLMRRLGLRRVAEAEWHVTHAGGELRPLLEAYAAGVNAAAGDRPRPAELTILRHRPEPWTPEDSLAVGRLLGLSQARAWESQLVRMRLLKAAGPDLAAAVDPALGAGVEAALDGLAADLAAVESILPLSAWTAASNCWAVAGAHTAGGGALLANDPHSALTMPSLWYQVHLRHPEGELSGFSVCGLPFLLAGHNRDVAWGLSSSGISIQDLYVERFNPDNPLQFDDPAGWQDAVRFRETIRVRGGRPVVEDVLVTRRGPIVSPALPGRQPPLSLRWVALDSEVDSLGWLLRLNRARGWPSFRAAVASCPSPPLAVTYADRAGSVGFRVAGFIPRRPPGRGRLPSAGWDGGGEWQGFLGLDEVPEALDPPGGVVVCANQRLPGAEGLPGDPLPPHRAERIRELLDALLARPDAAGGTEAGDGDAPAARTGRLTVAEMAAIQLDVVSIPARRLRALLLRHLDPPALDPDTAAGWTLLRDWDCRLAATSPAALLYERLRRRLRDTLLAGVADPALRAQLDGAEVHPLLPTGPPAAALPLLDLLESDRPAPGAVPDPAAVARLLAGALADAVAEIAATPGGRRWGDRQRAAFRHPLARLSPALGPLLSRGPFAVGGDLDTIRLAGSGSPRSLLPGDRGAVFRMVCDTADWSASRAGLVPGQSGHPAARAYADRIEDWRAGRLRPLPWGPPPGGATLTLLPAARRPPT